MAKRWRGSPPLISAPEGAYSFKDPSVLRFGGTWHVFGTVRAERPTHRIAHLLLEDPARPTMLRLGTGVAAPQVFLHRRDGRFFMICQAKDLLPYWCPAYATNETLDPDGWSEVAPLYPEKPAGVEHWLDFWVIGDGEQTYLFFTSLDGKMWRATTTTDRFPAGFGTPQVCLEADIFEAAHIYRQRDGFLCIVEAKRLGRRYQKRFVADRLDGKWRADGLFAAASDVEFEKERWTDSISHGELIRSGFSERMEINNTERYLFQGAKDLQVIGRPYPKIPWRVGFLTLVVDQLFDGGGEDLHAGAGK